MVRAFDAGELYNYQWKKEWWYDCIPSEVRCDKTILHENQSIQGSYFEVTIKSPCDTSWKSMSSDRSVHGEESDSLEFSTAVFYLICVPKWKKVGFLLLAKPVNSNAVCIRNSLRDYFVVTFNILLLQNHFKIFNTFFILKTLQIERPCCLPSIQFCNNLLI